MTGIAALALQQVNEAEQAEVDAGWDETIDRRLTELIDGEAQRISGRETIAIARAPSAAAQVTLGWNEHTEAPRRV